LRIGEACGLQVPDLYLPHGADEKDGFLFVRRSFSERAKANGGMVTPKSKKGRRTVDFDEEVTTALREHLKGRTTGLVFQARNGKPLRSGNLVKRVLNPILRKLGIPTGGRVNHAFRHGRVTELRKAGVADDTILQWIGHAVTSTTDGYSHLDRDLKFRREQLAKLKQ
jgi:integrase